jgi:hypothetical protein
MAELTGVHQQLVPQAQLQTRPAPPTPPPLSALPNPILGDAALHGLAGLAVCGLAPHSEAHPAAILLQLLAAFGNAVGPAACLRSRRNSPPSSTPCGGPRGTTGDHTADRILQAIDASDGSLSRKQINALFHGHLSSSRIEAALEQLISLGAIYQSSQPTGGRPSTLWSAIPESECLAGEEFHDESTVEETANEESMQEQT